MGSKGQSDTSASSSGLSKVQAASSARPWVAKVTVIDATRPRAQVRERRAQAMLELNTVQRWMREATGQWMQAQTHGQLWPPWSQPYPLQPDQAFGLAAPTLPI